MKLHLPAVFRTYTTARQNGWHLFLGNVILWIFLVPAALAQPFIKTLGDDLDQKGRHLAATSDRLVLVGRANDAEGLPNLFYQTHSTEGAAQALQAAGVQSTAEAVVAIGAEVFIAGAYSPDSTPGPGGTLPNADGLLVHVDDQGQPGWARRLGTGGDDQLEAVAAVDANAVYALGRNGDFFNGGTWLVKVNTDGALVWDKTFRVGDGADFPVGLVALSDGTVVTANAVGTFGSLTTVLTKWNGDGMVAWSRSYGVAGGELMGTDLLKASDGGFALAGQCMQGDTLGSCLIKLDGDGAVAWAQFYPEAADQTIYFNAITEVPSGGWITGGYVEQNNGGVPFLGSALVRLDASGQPVLSSSWMLPSGNAHTPIDALVTSGGGTFYGTGSHFPDGLLRPADATLFGFDESLDFGACSNVSTLDVPTQPLTIAVADGSVELQNSPVTVADVDLAWQGQPAVLPARSLCEAGGGSEEPDIDIPHSQVALQATVGTTEQVTVSVQNRGRQDLVIGAITPPGAPFVFAQDGCSDQMLAFGTQCTLEITFTPTVVDTFEITLEIPSNDPDENPATVTLEGRVVVPNLSVLPTLYFPLIPPGSSNEQTFVIHNFGPGALFLGQITATPDAFTLASDLCSNAQVTSFSECQIIIRYTAPPGESVNGTLTIPSNDPASPRIVPLRTDRAPVLEVPASLNFFSAVPGQFDELELLIRNNGGPALIGQITVAPTAFTLVSDPCSNAQVDAFSECRVVVRYMAPPGGSATGALEIPSDAPDGPHTVALQGDVALESMVNGGVRTLALPGVPYDATLNLRLVCRECLDPGLGIIEATMVEDRGRLTVLFNLNELRIIGAYDLVAEQDGVEHVVTTVLIQPFLALTEFRNTLNEGIGVIPVAESAWLHPNYMHIRTRSNTDDALFFFVSFDRPHPLVRMHIDPIPGSAIFEEDQPTDVARLQLIGGAAGKIIADDGVLESLINVRLAVEPEDVNWPEGTVQAGQGAMGSGKVTGIDFGSIHTVYSDFTTTAFTNSMLGEEIARAVAEVDASGDLCETLRSRPFEEVARIMAELESTRTVESVELLQEHIRDILNRTKAVIDDNGGGAPPKAATTADDEVCVLAITGAMGKFRTPFEWYEAARFLESRATDEAVEQTANDFGFNREELMALLKRLTESGARDRNEIPVQVRAPTDPNDKLTNTPWPCAFTPPQPGQDSTAVQCDYYPVPLANAHDTLDYTIRFENLPEATANARDVVITDTLDAKVDPTTLEIVGTSHDAVFSVERDGPVVTFRFTGIDLPPNQTSPEGEGFIRYTVAPTTGLSVGTEIHNRASIIFDFNPPIVTPEVIHRIVEEVSTAVEEAGDEAPDAFELSQNYPNPFNPTTTIPFALPQTRRVRLVLYDVLGREVAVLVDERLPAGRHEAVFEAHSLSSGVYFYRLETSHQTRTRTMLLLK